MHIEGQCQEKVLTHFIIIVTGRMLSIQNSYVEILTARAEVLKVGLWEVIRSREQSPHGWD